MRLFKKSQTPTFNLNLLKNDNLVDALKNGTSPQLAFPVGFDEHGNYVFTDLNQYGHIITAGQTGSGMAVFINTMLVSLMYKNTPEQLRFILIDPKMVSLSPYKNSKYLQRPWITHPEEAESAVRWLIGEVEKRFEAFHNAGVLNITEYNHKSKHKMPYILLVVDEVADLMMINPEFYKEAWIKLMRVSKAAGIMTFIGTHRTSHKIITEDMLANSFLKIAFTLPSEEASEFMIGQPGAERLKGRGDLLFSSPEHNDVVRLQAPYISEDSLTRVLVSL